MTADPTRLLADLDFVRRLALRLCGDEHTAEDVSQQTMVAALQAPPRNGNFRGWLASVARSLVYKQHRSKARRAARERAVARSLDVPSTEEVLEREQVRREVVAAVLALAEEHRQIILLRFYRGVSIADCAQRFDITESAVRSRIARAIERLRTQLDARHGGDRKRWAALLLPLAVRDPRPATATASAVRRAAWALVAAVVAVTTIWATSALGDDPVARQTATAAVATPADQPDAAAPPPEPLPVRTLAPGAPPQPPRLRWTAHGIVQDEHGALPGATITPWAHTGSNELADWLPLPQLRTDDQGRFSVPLDAIETWSELARAHGYLGLKLSKEGYWSTCEAIRLADILEHPDQVHRKFRLYEGANVHGRLLQPDGTPIGKRHIRCTTAAGSDLGETLCDGSFQAHCQPGGKVALACGVAGRGQFLQVVDLAGKQSADLGDVQLDASGPFLTGTARFPDGSPLRDAVVGLIDFPNRAGKPVPDPNVGWRYPNSVEAGGLGFPNDTVMNLPKFHGDRFTRTDDNGHFRILYGGPGTYRLSVGRGQSFRRELTIPAAGPPHQEVVYTSRIAKVIAQDEDGRVLPGAHVAWHTWYGNQAQTAHDRFEAEGLTDELLATAEHHGNVDRNRHEVEARIYSRKEAFHLIAVSLGGAKTKVVPCLLSADRYAATIRVALAPPGSTSVLQIEARTPSGEQVTPLFVRVRKQGRPNSSFLHLDAHPPEDGAGSRIAGPWQPVAADGRVELPLGTHDLDLLAGGQVEHGLLRGSVHPITFHTVSIEEGKTSTLRAELAPGARMRLRLTLPAGLQRDALRIPSQRVTLTRLSTGTAFRLTFRAEPGDTLVDGTLVLAAEQGLPQGEYRLAFTPTGKRYHEVSTPDGEAVRRMKRWQCRPIEHLVNFTLQREAFPLQLIERNE